MSFHSVRQQDASSSDEMEPSVEFRRGHPPRQRRDGAPRTGSPQSCRQCASDPRRRQTRRRLAYRTLSDDSSSVSWKTGSRPANDRRIAAGARIKERFASQGLEAALRRNYPPTHPLQRRVHGREEAQLIALACGPAPEGQQRWTLRLLADRMVQLHSVDQISYESVPQVLKKMNASPG
jgi:Homeodomain-like domain